MDPPAASAESQSHEYPDYVDLSDLTDEHQSSSDSSSSDSEESSGSSSAEEDDSHHHHHDPPESEDKLHHTGMHTPTVSSSSSNYSIEGDGIEQLTITSGSRCEHDNGGLSGNEADIDCHSDSDDSSTSTSTSEEASAMPDALEATATATTGREDATEDSPILVQQLTADLMQQYDPSRMELSEEEYGWALAVKDAIGNLPDLDEMSDFMYASLAILSNGNIVNAVERAYRLQEHMRDNNIMDTYDDALRNLPRGAHWLSIDYNLHTGGYIVAMDLTKTERSMFQNPEQTRHYHRRSFYAGHMAYCDLTALRAGTTVLIELQGYRPQYKLSNVLGVDLHAFRAICEGIYKTPRRVTKIKFFNTSPVFKLMMTVSKSALPREVTSKFQVAAKCPMGNLNTIYNIPSPEVAKARLQERMKGLLYKRYLNEMNFRLTKDPPSPVAING